MKAIDRITIMANAKYVSEKRNGEYRYCKICNREFYVPHCYTTGKSGRKGIYCSTRCSARANGFKKGNNWGQKNDKGLTRLTARIRSCDKYAEWRTKVFRRDNYKCIWCGKKGDIEADHIDPIGFFTRFFDLVNLEDAKECPYIWDINNGRTLCKACHKSTETYGPKFITYYKSL